MSGPSTRSHRSSVRGIETTLTELSDLLKANKSVLIISGAGLSVASGIPTFRGGSDSVWCVTAAAQGRRSVFLRDPLRWYNEFFLKHFPVSFTRKTPNAGHEAIAALTRAFPELRVITQNIDGLHLKTVNEWPDESRMVEAHGRLGLYKCVAEEDKKNEGDGEEEGGMEECPYSFEEAIKPSEFPESVRAALQDDVYAAAASGLRRPLTEVPRCPHCGEPSPPMSLLFDEDYDSHSFYDFEHAEEWFKKADAIVFVGTSFAVTLTSLAIREAKRRYLPVFDFNVSVHLKASPSLDAKTILGPAEATLPALARIAGVSLQTGDDHSDGGGNSAGSSGSSSGRSTSPSSTSTIEHQRQNLRQHHQDGGGVEANGNESPLGRRARDESSSDGEAGDAKIARCLTGGIHSAMPEEEDHEPPMSTSTPMPTQGAWGGGARYLLEPILETPLRKEQVRVDLSEAYSRKPHPDPEMEAKVEELWQQQLAKNPLLFNGTKFRLAGYSTEGDHSPGASVPAPSLAVPVAAAVAVAVPFGVGRDASEETGSKGGDSGGRGRTALSQALQARPCSAPTKMLRLQLGLTDYRTFRGTNWSPAASRLAADSARDFPWLEGAYLSQKFGVTSIVETADGFVLSLRRSSGVAEGQGMLGAPGGHPEPKNLGLTPEALRALSGKRPASRRKVGQQATEELFDSAVQEVVDETNVPRSALGEPLLFGIVRQGNSFGTPTAAFIIPCALEQAGVSELYAQGAKEAFESTELRVIPGAEVVAEGGAEWFAKHGLEATPAFEGALELWRAWRLHGNA